MSANPRILVLFCGGTLIMKESAGGALEVSDKEDAIELLCGLEPRLRDVVDLDLLFVDNIDSTNVGPTHWDTLSRAVADRYDDYDGFVITHGTDTLAYTASALSYALGNLGKPVVLTGSQIPGSRITSDARRNFVNAVLVAKEDLASVVIVFDEEVILGVRAHKISESKLNAFETTNAPLLGEIRIDVRLDPRRRRRHDGALELQVGFDPRIGVLTMTPALPPSVLRGLLDSGVRALVLRGFGTGNIPDGWLDDLWLAHERETPVVVTTQCREGATLMHLYEVGRRALEAGAIQAHDMSLESTATKLMWGLERSTYQTLPGLIHRNFCGEIVVPRSGRP